LSAAADADVESAVAELIVLVLKVPAGKYPQLVRGEVPEWDSLKHMELIFVLEDSFGVQFGEDEFASLSSPGAIARSIRNHRAA
jgi:acyl carrier protein